MRPLLCLGAFALLSATLFHTNGHYDENGVYCVVGALLLLYAAMARFPDSVERVAERALPWALLFVVEVQLCLLTLIPPGIYVTPGVSFAPFFIGLTLAGMVAATFLVETSRGANLRLGLLAAIFVALGVWMVYASPRPFIDVWYYEERAAEALLHGENPYAIDYPNIYHSTQFIDPSLLKDGRVAYHMYPPLSVILTIPGFLLGDARYSLIAATAGAALLLVGTTRRLGFRKGHPIELAAVAMMFHSRAYFLVEQAWTEPFPLLGACALAFVLSGRGPRGIIAALFLSAKQYSLFWIPSLWVTKKIDRRTLTIGVVGAAAILIPFFLWSPDGVWHGLVIFQIRQPFRDDALSVLALLHRRWGTQLPSAIGFAAGALTLGAGLWWLRRIQSRSLGDASLVGAAVYLAFFAFNKQAFFNYYWFSGAMILIALATTARAPEPPAETHAHAHGHSHSHSGRRKHK